MQRGARPPAAAPAGPSACGRAHRLQSGRAAKDGWEDSAVRRLLAGPLRRSSPEELERESSPGEVPRGIQSLCQTDFKLFAYRWHRHLEKKRRQTGQVPEPPPELSRPRTCCPQPGGNSPSPDAAPTARAARAVAASTLRAEIRMTQLRGDGAGRGERPVASPSALCGAVAPRARPGPRPARCLGGTARGTDP